MFQVTANEKEIKSVIQDTIKELLDPIDYISVNKETLCKMTDMDEQYLEDNILDDTRIKPFKRVRPNGRKPYWLTELSFGKEKRYLRDEIIKVIYEWN